MKTIKVTGESQPYTYDLVTSGEIYNLTGTFTSNGTLVIPAGYQIIAASVVNTTANAITGGVKIGTSDGGTQVAVAIATGANAVIGIPDATILTKFFSTSATQTLYVQAVIAWNSASINVNLLLAKMI